jgi:HSP20 family molecular chaperone IbpA
MKVKAMPIFTNDSFTDSDEEICKAKRRISFDENVHVFDMSKPAPKSPKRSKMITPILKQSPNVSSDEETEYLIPKRTPIPKSPKSSRNTGTIQSQAFLDEVINELKNHQQKVNNDLVTIPLSPKNENENKSYGHRRSPSSHDFFKSHSTVEDQIINSHEKYQVIIDITNCKKDDLQIKAKENLLEIDGKILEAKKRWYKCHN